MRRVDGEQAQPSKITESLALDAHNNVERTIAHVFQTRGIWEPIIARE